MFTTRDAETGKKRPKPSLPSNLAKIVETRYKTRLSRARQLAMSAEHQKALLDTAAQYRRENEIRRLSAFVNTPSLIHVARTANLLRQVPQQAEQGATTTQERMDTARVQLNKLMLEQEEYIRPMLRLRRFDNDGNPRTIV